VQWQQSNRGCSSSSPSHQSATEAHTLLAIAAAAVLWRRLLQDQQAVNVQ
jgi:MYXO-CTERM domain-containing protein